MTESTESAREPEPEVSIIILTYNNENTVEECLKSVLNTNYGNFKVVVIDGGSSDKTMDLLRCFENEDNLCLTSTGTPKSYSFARNMGAKLGATSKYLVFLDSDVIVSDANWLGVLVRFMESNPFAFGANPAIVSYKSRLGQSLGTSLQSMPPWDVANYEFMPAEKLSSMHEPQETWSLHGAAMILRREEFMRVGGFDEDIDWGSHDDLDLTWRLKLMGGRFYGVPTATVLHHGGATTKKLHASYQVQTFQYYQLYLMLKNMEWPSLVKYLPPYMLLSLVGSLVTARLTRIPFKGLIWNAKNLRRIFASRRRIQKYRLRSDKFVFSVPKIPMLTAYRILKRHINGLDS
jgi:GT2 family glycosyltransferase